MNVDEIMRLCKANEELRAELATMKRMADLCDFAPEADQLAEENKALRARAEKAESLVAEVALAWHHNIGFSSSARMRELSARIEEALAGKGE